MSRKKCRRKIWSTDINPVAHAIAGAAITTQDILNKLRMAEYSALDTIIHGQGTTEHWQILANLLNVAQCMAEEGRLIDKAITAIRARLEQPEQEPVVWVRTNGLNNSGVAHYGPTCPPGWVGAATAYFKAPPPEPEQKPMHPELKKLYEDFFDKCFKETVDLALGTTPPAAQREWVGLTDDQIYEMYNEPRSDAEMLEFARAIEAKLKEKNNG